MLKAATGSPSNQQPELPHSGEAQAPLEMPMEIVASAQPILSLTGRGFDVEVPLAQSNESPIAATELVADDLSAAATASAADVSAFAHRAAQIEPARRHLLQQFIDRRRTQRAR